MAFFDPFNGMFGANQETEEERRRREEEERLRIERETPVKQTIEIDPTTGAQKVKIEGSAYNLSSANPLTPTVNMGPVAPEEPKPQAYLGTPGFNPQATTPTMTPAVTPEQDRRRPVINDIGQVLGMETPEQSVVGAVTGAPVAPAVPGQPTTAPTMTPTAGPAQPGKPKSMAEQEMERRLAGPMETMPEGQMGPAVGQMGEKDWAQTFARSQKDPNALAAIQADSSAPEWVRKLSAETQYDNMRMNKMNEKAANDAQQAILNKDGLAISRRIKEEGEEGSIFRAFLYSKLGLNKLAEDEQMKLGGGQWQTVTDPITGTSGMVYYSRSGLPTKGLNSDGSAMTDKQLAGYGAGGGGGKNLDIVGGTYVNDQTGEVGRVVTDKRTGRSYIQTDKGVKPMTGFRPQASGGSLSDQRARLIQEINLKLQGKSKEEAMVVLRDYNSKLVGQGLSPVQPTELNISVGQISGGAPTTASAAAPAPVAPSAPSAPAATTTAPATGPVAPTATRTPAAPPRPAPAPTAAPAGATPPAPGRRPTATEIEATGTAQKEEAKISGEDIGKIKRDQTAAESSADYLISKVQGLIVDPATGEPNPGFEVSVGASAQPGFQFIPGSDKATWYAAFDEVKGQQFLTAIKELKGMGALSDREGEAATKAISRMSTMTDEKSFRRAAEDFQDIVSRGIDRNRAKLGQAPKYGTPEQSERDRQDRAAVEWLKKNAKDPKAKEVRQRLKDRGIL